MTSATRLTLAYLQQAPESAARTLEKLDLEEVTAFLAGIPARLAAPVINKMPPLTAAANLTRLPAEHGAAIIQQLDFQDMTSLLRVVPAAEREVICNQLPTILGRRLQRSLHYVSTRVGAWTEPDVPILQDSQTVQEALRLVRDRKPVVEVFIESAETNKYIGVILVKDLLRADPHTLLENLHCDPVKAVSNRASLKSVAFLPSWDERFMLPVTGKRGTVLGALSSRGLRRGIRESHDQPTTIASPVSLIEQLGGALAVTADGFLSLVTSNTQSSDTMD